MSQRSYPFQHFIVAFSGVLALSGAAEATPLPELSYMKRENLVMVTPAYPPKDADGADRMLSVAMNHLFGVQRLVSWSEFSHLYPDAPLPVRRMINTYQTFDYATFSVKPKADEYLALPITQGQQLIRFVLVQNRDYPAFPEGRTVLSSVSLQSLDQANSNAGQPRAEKEASATAPSAATPPKSPPQMTAPPQAPVQATPAPTRRRLDLSSLVTQADINRGFREAASGGDTASMQLLLKRGAEIDSQMPFTGWTALINAATGNQVEAVKFLIRHRADPFIKAADGYTARRYVESNGNHVLAKLLLDYENRARRR